MSNITISGTLVLNGHMACDGDINVTSSGEIIPIPVPELSKSFYSYEINRFITANGQGRTIQSTTGSITIDGKINGTARGFASNQGPGANSILLDNFGLPIPGYGATHAGRGTVDMPEGVTAEFIEEFYITTDEIDARHVRLTAYPVDPDNVAVNMVEGTSLEPGVDYYIEDNLIKWTGKELEPLISAGDIMRVIYLGDLTPVAPPSKKPYGSYEAPTSLGSGSGFRHDPRFCSGVETRGGGAVKLVARSGEVTVNGSIIMNGQNGVNAGGAAGGSIWVIGFRVLGTGIMRSDGGHTAYSAGGGGGGGYISIWHEKSSFYSGTLSVEGKDGAEDGKIFIKQFEPILEDRFTGKILNQKWWDIVQEPVGIDNEIYMDTSAGDTRVPVLESKFDITGKNFITDFDYIPRGTEPNFFSAEFRMYIDDRNWVGIARKNGYIFGVHCEDGLPGQTGVPFPYVPLTFRLIKTDSTFTYQYYDSTSLPQTFLVDTIPAFSSSTFKARLTLESPEFSDASFIVEYFKTTAGDVANKHITLSYTPSDSSDVALNIVGGTAQMFLEDYVVEGKDVSWDKSKLVIGTELQMVIVDYYILTPVDIFFKQIILSSTPLDPVDVTIDPIKGTPQFYGLDYYVDGNVLKWDGRGLDGLLAAGDQIRVMYWGVPFPINYIEDYIGEDDIFRVIYEIDGENADTSAAFDNFRLFEGIPVGAETTEPVLYVDPLYGSDASDGRQLSPLQNLFVATKWSKKGGIVVLYDGTHSPTDVQRKDLTLRGADGVKPLITSINSQDTTGSGWETNALNFWSCQGVVKNVKIRGSEMGIITENSQRFDIQDCDIADATIAVKIIKSDPNIMRNRISGAQIAIDCTDSNDCYIGSNVLFEDTTAIRMVDTTTSTVQSNTIDDCTTGISIDDSSWVVVASNSLTNLETGIFTSNDSTSFSYGNNFYGTVTPHAGKAPDVTSGNISQNPSYVDQTGRDYHLNSDSSNKGAGYDAYDEFFMDFDGVNRSLVPPSDIGAYEYVNRDHSGEYYVAGAGDDLVNNGGRFSPFRTLDRAMQVADSSVHIDGGHYDSYYLHLKSENIDLNIMTVIYPEGSNFITYVTLNAVDVAHKKLLLPGLKFLEDVNLDNVAINIVKGGPQQYGLDYVIVDGYLTWEGLGWDGIVSAGDVLRIMFFGTLGNDALETFTIQPHFSNIDFGNLIFVSPNGSDQTSLGGDGTNSGGDGSKDRPYRTVEWALQNSAAGDHLIVMAGEYPLFNGLECRTIVPGFDRTSIVDKYPRRYIEDLFGPTDFRPWNHTDFDQTNWYLDFTGDSTISINGGFLGMSYDGTNPPSANSMFSFSGDFEVSVQLRNGIDPAFFSVFDSSTNIFFRYDNGDCTAGATDNSVTQACWGHVNVDPILQDKLIVEHIWITSDHTRAAEAALSYLPEPDCTNFALNIVGGVSQNYGEDFIIKDSKIVWRGLNLDGEIVPGDVLRIIYKDRELSNPVLVKFTKYGDRVTIKVYDYTGWTTLLKKDIHYPGDGTWSASFFMNESTGLSHDCIFGKGYFSKFKAVAEEFYNTDVDKEYLLKTERRPLIFYEDRT